VLTKCTSVSLSVHLPYPRVANRYNSPMLIVQIYEVTSAAEAEALADLGVSHVGVLVGKGKFPREQSFDAACSIFAAVAPPVKKVSLSLGETLAEVAEVVQKTQPDIVHIGTWPEALPPEDVVRLREFFPAIKIMRTIPVRTEDDIRLASSYKGIADYLLLDTCKAGDPSIGATGCVHDWSLSRKIVEASRIPVILAGGIGPENAEEAIRLVNPAGVDSKTRTDKPGGHTKDLEKVRSLVEAVSRTARLASSTPSSFPNG
jgi:phosphoribosylanthranilate isomerase